jgi:hypothetical protein
MAHQASQIIIGQIGDIFGSNFKHAYQFFAVFGFLQQSMGLSNLPMGLIFSALASLGCAMFFDVRLLGRRAGI